MKTIAWVNYTWKDSRGPSKKYIEYLLAIKSQDKENCYIAIFPPCPEEARIKKTFDQAGITYELCPITWFTNLVHRDINKRAKAFAALKKNVASLLKILLKHKCDLVIANTSLSWEAVFAARKCGIKHITFFRGVLNPYDFVDDSHIDFDILRDLEQEQVRLTDHKITQSTFTAKLWGFLNDEDWSVIPLGTKKITCYLPPSMEEGLKIITLCSIEKNKNIELIITLAKRLTLKGVPVIFDIYGNDDDGQYKESIERKIMDLDLEAQVKIHDHIRVLGDIICKYHVVFISSHLESFGATAIEGMAARRCVVSTKCGGPEEIIIHDKTGYLLDNSNIVAFINIFEKLYHNELLVRKLGEEGYKRWSKKYDLNVTIKAWRKLIRQVLKKEEQHEVNKYNVENWSESIRKIMKLENWEEKTLCKKWLVIAKSHQYPSSIIAGNFLSDISKNCNLQIGYETEDEVDLSTEDADVVVFLRTVSEKSLLILKEARQRGKKTLYYVDDSLFDLPKYAKQYMENKVIQDMHITGVDQVITISPWLREAYRSHYGDKIKVESIRPVFHDPQIPPMIPGQKDIVTIGFAGNVDYKYVLEDLKKTCIKIHDLYGTKIRFEFIGAKPSFLEEVEGLHFPPMSFDEYEIIMARRRWDIGIAYLPDTPFNNNKHYNKYMEYARFGICGIYSDIGLYRRVIRFGDNGLLVKNEEGEWFIYLRYLIDHPKLREKMSAHAKEDFNRRNKRAEIVKENMGVLSSFIYGEMVDLTEEKEPLILKES